MILVLFLFFWAVSLHAADITATLDSSDGSSALVFKAASTVTVGSIDSASNMQIKGGMRIDSAGAECTTAEMLIVDGNIGVGTDNPQRALHVYGAGGKAAIRVEGSSSGAPAWRAALELVTDVDARGRGTFYKTGNADPWFCGVPYGGSGFSIGMDATQPEYHANSFLFVNENGRVGIGITNPGASLEVAGKIKSQNARAQTQLTAATYTSSTTWVDLMSVSVTIGDNSLLILFVPSTMQGTGGNCRAHFRLLLNGTEKAGTTEEFHNSGWETRTSPIMYLKAAPGAGTYTATIQWKIDTGTQIGLNWHQSGWTWQTTQLIAIEL